jgi:hypothetical protein
MLGITIAGSLRKHLGLGDQIQFSSFPENYFLNKGEKVIDLDNNPIFDFNPYIVRGLKPTKVLDLWFMTDGRKYLPKKWIPSISERNSWYAGLDKCYIRHPKLYLHEDIPLKPKQICVHLTGVSTGNCPDEVADQIRKNYKDFDIAQIGLSTDKQYGQFEDKRGLSFWDSAKVIAESLIFIGVSSSMMNVAACYPRAIKKIIITESDEERAAVMDDMMPMDVERGHYHWLDWGFGFYNKTKRDIGVSYSYLKI